MSVRQFHIFAIQLYHFFHILHSILLSLAGIPQVTEYTESCYVYYNIIYVFKNKLQCFQFNSVQFSCSGVSDSAAPWTAEHQASLSITNSQSSLKLMSIESVMPSSHLILCRPHLLLPSIFPSIRVFSKESVLCIKQPKYQSFSFSISPSNECSGLISFGIDWFDLVVQGTLKSHLQHRSSKPSILRHSAFPLWSNSHIHV